jgi:NADH:ubiquinone oxidoreductase subunit D
MTPDQLAIELSVDSHRRLLLVGGMKNEKEVRKFVNTLEVPKEVALQMVGATWGYTNVQIISPQGESFYVIQICGSDLLWEINADAALAAGYLIADVRDQKILIRGQEATPIPVWACTGLLHNVYADSV